MESSSSTPAPATAPEAVPPAPAPEPVPPVAATPPSKNISLGVHLCAPRLVDNKHEIKALMHLIHCDTSQVGITQNHGETTVDYPAQFEADDSLLVEFFAAQLARQIKEFVESDENFKSGYRLVYIVLVYNKIPCAESSMEKGLNQMLQDLKQTEAKIQLFYEPKFYKTVFANNDKGTLTLIRLQHYCAFYENINQPAHIFPSQYEFFEFAKRFPGPMGTIVMLAGEFTPDERSFIMRLKRTIDTKRLSTWREPESQNMRNSTAYAAAAFGAHLTSGFGSFFSFNLNHITR